MSNDPTISNIMNLAKLFTSDVASTSKGTSEDKSWPMFPLDAQIHTEPLRVCKSLVPYLPYEKQKTLCIFIKVYELMSVVDHFAVTDPPPDKEVGFRQSETWQSDLLYSVKDNLDPQNAYWVDIFFKIKEVSKILETAKSAAPSSQEAAPTITATDTHTTNNPMKSEEFVQNISPMLDDNQKRMLEMLSTIIK